MTPLDATTLTTGNRRHLLGLYDGIERPQISAALPRERTVEDIKWLAGQIGKDKKAMLLHNYALARCASADNVPQIIMTVGAMGGHMGKSGHAVGGAYKTFAGNCGATLAFPGEDGLPKIKNPISEYISAPLLWQSILMANSTITVPRTE